MQTIDSIYTTPFAGGDIGINRVDTHEQWGRDPGDRTHLVTYDVTINKGMLSGGFDNLREARAFLEGYVRGVDVTLRAVATPIVAANDSLEMECAFGSDEECPF